MIWDLELYLKYQFQKGIEPISINRYIYILRSFYSFLEKRKIISENIARLLEPMSTEKKERTSLDREEIKSLVDKIDHQLIKTVVITLANTGLRISELVNLKLSHVDLDHRLINVVNGKGGKNR